MQSGRAPAARIGVSARPRPRVRRGSLPPGSADLGYVLPYLIYFPIALHTIALLAGRLAAELQKVRILGEEILANLAKREPDAKPV